MFRGDAHLAGGSITFDTATPLVIEQALLSIPSEVWLTPDGCHQRIALKDRLVASYLANAAPLALRRRWGAGYIVLTESAKRPGYWQLTYFMDKMTPVNDSQYPSKRMALDDFFRLAYSSRANAVTNDLTANSFSVSNVGVM